MRSSAAPRALRPRHRPRPGQARPAVTAAKGVDLTLLILALGGVVAVYLAIRGGARALRE